MRLFARGSVAVAGAAVILGMGSLACAADSTSAEALKMRTYTQELTLEFASPAEASAATLKATPVFEGKKWAFSARWDDDRPNNVRMAELLTKCGLSGTFYLNKSGKRGGTVFGEDYAKKVTVGNCSIGGHSLTHPMLTDLLPDETFYEIMANRIEWEVLIDQPLNSFAFPFGRFEVKGDPGAEEMITNSLLSAGYHNTTYDGLVVNNPDLQPHEMSTALMTRPGDRVVDAAKYLAQIAKIEKFAADYQKHSACMYLGIHVAYAGKGWDDIEQVCRKMAGRPDWWYCNLTQWGAYDREANHTTIEAMAADGSAVRKFRLTRPVPAELGDLVPLTLEVTGGTVKSIGGSGFKCERVEQTADGRTLLNVPHSSGYALPAKIDAIQNSDNAAAPAKTVKFAKFGELSGWLVRDAAGRELTLTLSNNGPEATGEFQMTWRLPPEYVVGLKRGTAKGLAAGETRVLRLPLGEVRTEGTYRPGSAYYAVEMEFLRGGELDRAYVTTHVPAVAESGGAVCVRDAAQMAGPFAEEQPFVGKLEAMSAPSAGLESLGEGADRQWFTASAEDRNRFGAERLTLYHDSKAWKDAIASYSMKPKIFAAAMDFTLSEPSAVKLMSSIRPSHVFLNGKEVKAEGMAGVAGVNRCIVVLPTKDDRGSFAAYPSFLRLTPASGKLECTLVPARP